MSYDIFDLKIYRANYGYIGSFEALNIIGTGFKMSEYVYNDDKH